MQNKQLVAIVISGLSALYFSGSAWAVMSAPNGWYLEANAGSSHSSGTDYPGSVSSSGIGGNVNIGYKFMPYVAGEIGYTQYSNTTLTASSFEGGTKAGTVKNYSYDLAVKGILPVYDSGFELFAKLGAERVNAHVSIDNSAAATSIGLTSSQHSQTGLYYGIGAQFYFMPELAVVGQWQQAQGSNSTGTMSLLSGGISFIFD